MTTRMSGCMYTLHIDLRTLVVAYRRRMGYSPAWIAGPRDAVNAVPPDVQEWLQRERITLVERAEAKGCWWAGVGRLP